MSALGLVAYDDSDDEEEEHGGSGLKGPVHAGGQNGGVVEPGGPLVRYASNAGSDHSGQDEEPTIHKSLLSSPAVSIEVGRGPPGAYVSPRPVIEEVHRSAYSSPAVEPTMALTDTMLEEEDEREAEPATPYFDQLPPEAEGECDPAVQARITDLLVRSRSTGARFTATLKSKKDFGNPELLQKVIDVFEIDQFGSNYPTELYDPKACPEEDFIDRLQKQLNEASKASSAGAVPVNTAPPPPNPLAAAGLIPGMPGGIAPVPLPASAGGADAGRPPRVSKWGTQSVPTPPASVHALVAQIQSRVGKQQAEVGGPASGLAPSLKPPLPVPGGAAAKRREQDGESGGEDGAPVKKKRFSSLF